MPGKYSSARLIAWFLLVICAGIKPNKAAAQTDTLHISPYEYLVTDSANVPELKKRVALGKADDIGDRIYFKNGIPVDWKKSFPFGFIYIQFDTLGRIRHHQLWHEEFQTKVAIKLTYSGKVFWSDMRIPQPTQYILQDNGAFEKVVITTNDSIPSLSNYWKGKKKPNGSVLQYRISFLRNGLPEQFGFEWPDGTRIGEWQTFNLFCNCYQKTVHFIP